MSNETTIDEQSRRTAQATAEALGRDPLEPGTGRLAADLACSPNTDEAWARIMGRVGDWAATDDNGREIEACVIDLGGRVDPYDRDRKITEAIENGETVSPAELVAVLLAALAVNTSPTPHNLALLQRAILWDVWT